MSNIPEPPDGTALYWHETGTLFARLIIRDDAAAEASGQEPGAHWFAPNSQDTGLTWTEFWEVVNTGPFANPIDQAITLSRPGALAGAPEGEADRAATPSAAGAPPAHGAPAHANCDRAARAYKPVKCDRCGREYVCTPSSDFYCTAEGDHCCEPCLIGDRPLITMNRPAANTERRYEP